MPEIIKGNGQKVLIVDDEPIVREGFGLILQTIGYDAVFASSGEEAVSRYHGWKPDVVLFGEQLPSQVLNEASHRSYVCDLFIVIGSTLIVYPAAYMPIYATTAGTKLVIINLSATPLDHQAAVLIRARAGETMSKIVEKVKEKVSH